KLTACQIRCDGALQNGPWPCGACLRLKLKCVPPTLDPDDEHQQSHDSTTGQGQFSFQQPTTVAQPSLVANPPPPPPPPPPSQEWSTSYASTLPSSAAQSNSAVVYDPHVFAQVLAPPRLDHTFTHPTQEHYATAGGGAAALPSHKDAQDPGLYRSTTNVSEGSGGDPAEIDAALVELSGAMGDLKIDITSAAAYMSNEKRILADAPAVEEVDIVLPPSVSADSTVRIPPEMMPSDERAMEYFGYFFDYIHPYVPVLNKRNFYHQWRHARHSISPLLLEGLFACVARYLEEPIEIRRWLALASRHEESFKDVPRLSTIQAMILLMKAREFVPKRGYYYRSWMMCKYMTTMAFDLGLPEHLESHRSGNRCLLGREDCIVRTRIWQCLFGLEILVGASQGRTDFAVEMATVDQEVPAYTADVDPFEQHTSRRWTYLVQSLANIKQSNELWQATRRFKKDWALEDPFVKHNEDLVVWMNNLPQDLQLHFAEDGSPPWLGGDHFRAYLHIYHHLVIVMHHRPQLQAMLEKRDPNFRLHLDVLCHSAAQMCRVQEALYRDFGMHGLSFMNRGTNFTIYCVLTCTMMHLAAITSPDPIMNSSARSYFTRHMRILEYCLPQASAEMQDQINALREAFSKDPTKQFELKPTLGLRSPPLENRSPPVPSTGLTSATTVPSNTGSSWYGRHDSQGHSSTASPTSDNSQSYDYLTTHENMTYPSSNYDPAASSTFAPQNINAVPQQSFAIHASSPHEQPAAPPPVWDPSGIFNQWHAAFGGSAPPQPGQHAQQPASVVSQQLPTPTSAGSHPSPTEQDLYSSSLQTNARQALPEQMVHVNPMPMVTPVMWQDAFTNAYVSGHGKRYRDDAGDNGSFVPYSVKRRG
ncbi:hypothetical protein K431DRAFT_304790, partial [Polychaeton citri CBS 116435]